MKTDDAEHIRTVRSQLLARRMELRERRQQVLADLARTGEPLPADPGDAAVGIDNDDVVASIEARMNEEVGQIDRALERADVGALGLCERCGAEISPARLAIIPQATCCIDCERSS
jgi:RNA polymerase-binding transcription factor